MADENVVEAAKQILHADFLLIATGAGFSADSGLATYATMNQVPTMERLGMEYNELCCADLLSKDPARFYGFWGWCLNTYRDTKPHEGACFPPPTPTSTTSCHLPLSSPEGYELLSRWLKLKREQHGSKDVGYVYTSNVDAHCRMFQDFCHVFELHGSVEEWCCSMRECPQSSTLIAAPPTFRSSNDS